VSDAFFSRSWGDVFVDMYGERYVDLVRSGLCGILADRLYPPTEEAIDGGLPVDFDINKLGDSTSSTESSSSPSAWVNDRSDGLKAR
jgi:hypothetical protein